MISALVPFTASAVLIVAVWLTTVMVGAFVASNVRVPPLPLSISQLCRFPLSPKTRLPMVGELSRVTKALAASVSVLKSAVRLAPLATTVFDQLAVTGQEPPAVLIQVGTAGVA